MPNTGAMAEHDERAAEWVIPRHVAVIMDGNGRWAQERGLQRLEGHYEGLKAARRLLRAASDREIPIVSLYAFSSENWSRPRPEVAGLMSLMEEALMNELAELLEREARVRYSGRMDDLPVGLRARLEEAVATTAGNTGLVLNLCINYGGRAEIVDAARAIAAEVESGDLALDEVDEEVFQAHLYNGDLSPVDLLIRPGGELRVSNFLLWQIAYAEFYVLPTYWPEFTEKHLDAAIADYNRRQRRYGGVQDEA